MSEAASSLPCPTCGKTAERQLSGGAGLVFKGSGFYLTDYGKNAHRTSGTEKPGGSGEKAGGGEPSSKSSEAKGGESKPAETKPVSGGSGGSDKSSGTKKKSDT